MSNEFANNAINTPESHDMAYLYTNPMAIEERTLYAFFSYLFWPFMFLASLLGSVAFWTLALLRQRKSNLQKYKEKYLVYLLFVVLLPYYLIQRGWKHGNYKLICGGVLLLPLMATSLLSFVPPFLFGTPEGTTGGLSAPSFSHWMGTNGEGVGIFTLIILGARNSYLISLIATMIALIPGVVLGKMTANQRSESIIMGCVQVIETIPILFLLLVVLALFIIWGDIMREQGGLIASMEPMLRILVLGVTIGIGYMPQIIRLIRERIKSFLSEDFVDVNKAHGIDQNRILWFHIIRKNCLGDIIIAMTQIWGAALLVEISLSYLFSIGSSKLGAESYHSWAEMLLRPETKASIIFLNNWWLYVFPSLFIIFTIVGFYLFGDGLRDFHEERKHYLGESSVKLSAFDRVVTNRW